MKIIKCLSIILLCISILSCSFEEEVSKNEEQTTQVRFILNLLGNMASTKGNDLGSCPDLETLIMSAYTNDLVLNLTIDENTQEINVNYIDSTFISDPIILNAKSLPYKINQATISNKNGDVLFSSIASTSPYAQYVEKSMPLEIKMGYGGLTLYQKNEVSLELICAVNEKPQIFGFVKWNITVSKLYCMSFVVNQCDTMGIDRVAKGTLQIMNGIYENGTFTPVSQMENKGFWKEIDVDIPFPTSISGEIETPASFCFADNYNINNDKEYYRFKLIITEPLGKNKSTETLLGYANVDTLLKYKESNAWETDQNILHLNLCNCNAWFMPCTLNTNCRDSIRINLLQDSLTANNGYQEIVKINSQDININSTTVQGISFQAGDKIRFTVPIKYYNQGENFSTYINIKNGGQYENATLNDTIYHVNIYEEYCSSMAEGCNVPVIAEFKGSNLMKTGWWGCWTTNLPTSLQTDNDETNLVSGNCYYYEIVFDKTPLAPIFEIEIKQGKCPIQEEICSN